MKYDRSDPTSGPVRRPLLLAIERLGIELGRSPRLTEIQSSIGVARRPLQRHLAKARRLGLVTPEHQPLRLTTAARVALGLPTITYLAWPVPAATAPGELWEVAMLFGLEAANELASRVPGLVPVSPFFTAAADPEHAGPVLAARCDAVIVLRDPLLVGRADVVAARRQGLPVSVLRDVADCVSDPWGSDHLLTNDPQLNQRS